MLKNSMHPPVYTLVTLSIRCFHRQWVKAQTPLCDSCDASGMRSCHKACTLDTADIKVYINKYSEVKQSSREAHGHESLLLQCFLSHALTSRSVMELNCGISLVTAARTQRNTLIPNKPKSECVHVHFWPQFRMQRRQMAPDEGGWAGYSMSSIHLDCVLNPKWCSCTISKTQQQIGAVREEKRV